MRRVSWAQVCARRLARHYLSRPAPDLATAAGAICGAHAQVLSAAELSLALRVPDTTRVDVRAALWADHALVKTYGPRGTVHLFPAVEWAGWSAGLAAAPRSETRLPEPMRMAPEQIDAVIEAIGAALAGADLTVDELDEQVVARTGPWAGERVMPAFDGMWPRWRRLVVDAAHRGVLCFGPNRGRKVTYADPRRMIPGFAPPTGAARAVDAADPLATMALRYLRAYGPATPAEFAQWLAIGRPVAVALFDRIADRLAEVSIDEASGGPAYIPADDRRFVKPAGPDGLRLLPYFDAYAVGSHPRELLFPGPATRALTHGQAGTVAVMLIDGTVAGIWHQRRSGRRLTISVEPFARLTATHRRELADQVERIGAILEADPELLVGKVTAGSHL
jgi:Winged helix DNA-binding domain